MIVRWSLAELLAVLAELHVERPLLVASERWSALDLPRVGRWSEVPSNRIEVPAEADSLLAVGGGSAIDTAKLASTTTALPVISVPTTYSGAEWTTGFGVRTPDRRLVGGGSGARVAAIVYDVDLTRDLPVEQSVGTALNALNHCAEALYVRGRNDAAERCAIQGARLLAASLPGLDRGGLLEGAALAGEALSLAGVGLAHAMAQSLGGTYGLPHGAMNALCLPPVLDFVGGEQVDRLGAAIGSREPSARLRELARLGGFERLREFAVPSEELPLVAAAAAARPGNRAMPRPATPRQVEELLVSIY